MCDLRETHFKCNSKDRRKDGNGCAMQMIVKTSRTGYINIRENRLQRKALLTGMKKHFILTKGISPQRHNNANAHKKMKQKLMDSKDEQAKQQV